MRRTTVFFCALLAGGCRNSSDPVVAKVGSLRITQSEFRRKLGDVSQGYQNYVLTPNGRRQFLDVLIRERMILAAAMNSDVPQSPEFRAEMTRLKSEEEERLKEGRDYLLTRLWIEDLRAKGTVKASDEEAREYLKKHPIEVSVRHILLGTPEEAGEVAKKVRGGANFAAVAKAQSLDAATAADGGKMPPAVYGEIIPELEDVVFRMRVGEIGGPLKSKFGYHVIKKDSERTLAFAEGQERVARLLEKQKLDHYLQTVQQKYPVEVVDEQLK